MRFFRTTFLILAGVLLLANPASAIVGISVEDLRVDFNKLTQQQRATIVANAAQLVASEEAVTSPDLLGIEADDVAPWLGLVDKVGEGLVKLAGDLGVTANELLVSPVGLVTVALIAYHVMGDEIMGVLCGLLWFFLTLPFLLLFFYKLVIPVRGYTSQALARSFGRDPITVDVPRRREVDFEEGPECIFVIGLVLQLLVTVIFFA